MDPGWLVLPGLIIWSGMLLLPWRPWSTRERFDANPAQRIDLSNVTVLIPARNEAHIITGTLDALQQQGSALRVIVIDDNSTDDTHSAALRTVLSNLTIINGEALPPEWSGKLWALEQGRRIADTGYLLLLDADIRLQPGTISCLLEKLQREGLQMLSLMAQLRMVTLWEKLLMPAFIFFFKLLYPFHIANSKSKVIAAAAGGCILIDATSLAKIGGFAVLRSALIDDCALARHIKNNGGRTWIGLTHSAISSREYNDLGPVWKMVARTAFTQLQHSVFLLGVCTLAMVCAFVLPVITLFGAGLYLYLAVLTMVLMAAGYLPTLKFYGMEMYWALFLPVIGIIYLLMTWHSAISHWRGTGAIWKDRTYRGYSL